MKKLFLLLLFVSISAFADIRLDGRSQTTPETIQLSTSVPTNYATLDAALSYLSKAALDGTKQYTVNLPVGVQTVSTSIFQGNLANVTFHGTSHTFRVASVQSSTGSAGSYSVILNINSADMGNMVVGKYLGITAASGGTHPDELQGTFKITNVDAVNNRITVPVGTTLSAAPSGAVTVTVGNGYVYDTSIDITAGLDINSGGHLVFDNVAVVNGELDVFGNGVFQVPNQAAFYNDFINVNDTATCLVGNTTIGQYGFNGFVVAYNASLLADNIVIGNPNIADASGHIIDIYSNGFVSMEAAKLNGAAGAAITVYKGSNITVEGTDIMNSAIGIQAVGGSFVNALNVTQENVTTTYAPPLDLRGTNGGLISSYDYTGFAFPSTFTDTLAATTGAIAPGVLAAGACGSGTVSVTNSTTSMTVSVTPNTYPGDSVFYKGYVSSNGTVTVKVCEAVAGTPTSSTYNVRVHP